MFSSETLIDVNSLLGFRLMRLGVSGLFVKSSQVGGAEFMLKNLVEGLGSRQTQIDAITLFTNYHWDASLPDIVQQVQIPKLWMTNRFLQESVLLPRYIQDLDVILFPNYFTPPLRTNCSIFTVIHDVQYKYFPEHFGRTKCLWLRYAHELTLRRADQIIAISEFTREDLIRFYGSRFADKITVIRNPVSWSRFDTRSADDERWAFLDRPYLLTVGAHYPWKNVTTLLEAFRQVRQLRPDLQLVIVGQVPEHLIGTVGHPDLRQRAIELGIESHVHILGHVSDSHLGMVYRNAELFVFPSLFEGFGMPPIEALGMGLPVLTSQSGSLIEVTRGLATFIDDPKDARRLGEQILEILANRAKFTPMSQDVHDLRQYYSPEQVAQEYYGVFSDKS